MKKQSRWKRVGIVLSLALSGFLVLSAESCDAPADDRTTGKGTAADGYQDTSQVVIWRNADQIPNVATFCADGLAWAATLSSDGMKVPNLLRIPEHDSRCGTLR